MQAVVLHCRPKARFHFGKVGPDNNTSLASTTPWLPSDTLFSAIANNLAALYPDAVSDLLEYFHQDKIRLSSGFYLLRVGSRDIYFLPKPAHFGFEVMENFKAYSRVQLISKKVWESGWTPGQWEANCYFLQNGTVLVAKDELKELEAIEDEKSRKSAATKIHLYEEQDFPRVKIHAMSQDDAFFYLSTVCVADPGNLRRDDKACLLPDSAVHFYFLLEVTEDFSNHPDLVKIRAAIRLLADNGIGGERSAGCGRLEAVTFMDFVPPVAAGGQQCAVSLVLPSEPELPEFIAYQLDTRGGREYTGGKLKFVRMMQEGAISLKTVQGRIARIGDKKKEDFLRYGKAFCLPVRAILPPKSMFES